MYAENNAFPNRPDALPLNLIWGLETTSKKKIQASDLGRLTLEDKIFIQDSLDFNG